MNDLQLFKINGLRRIRLHKSNGMVHGSLKTELEIAMPSGATAVGLSWTQNNATKTLEQEASSKWANITLTYKHAQALSQTEIDALQATLDSHPGNILLRRDLDTIDALAWKRDDLTSVDWSTTALTVAERKLILNQALTTTEEDAFITEWNTAGRP